MSSRKCKVYFVAYRRSTGWRQFPVCGSCRADRRLECSSARRPRSDLCRATDHDAQQAFINSLRDNVDKRHRFFAPRTQSGLRSMPTRAADLLLDSDLEWLLSSRLMANNRHTELLPLPKPAP